MKPAPWICPGCDSSLAGPGLGNYVAVPDNPDFVYPYAICHACVSSTCNRGSWGPTNALIAEAAERVLRDPQRYGTALGDRRKGLFYPDEMHPALVNALGWSFKRSR